MRRLIATIYKRCLGIRVTTAHQHVEDLRKMVNDLCNARDALDAEIPIVSFDVLTKLPTEDSNKESVEAPAVVRSNRPAVAYRHPENSDLEWTGRGRQPKWVEAWIKQGNTLESLAVAQRCDKTLEIPGL